MLPFLGYLVFVAVLTFSKTADFKAFCHCRSGLFLRQYNIVRSLIYRVDGYFGIWDSFPSYSKTMKSNSYIQHSSMKFFTRDSRVQLRMLQTKLYGAVGQLKWSELCCTLYDTLSHKKNNEPHSFTDWSVLFTFFSFDTMFYDTLLVVGFALFSVLLTFFVSRPADSFQKNKTKIWLSSLQNKQSFFCLCFRTYLSLFVEYSWLFTCCCCCCRDLHYVV